MIGLTVERRDLSRNAPALTIEMYHADPGFIPAPLLELRS